MKKRRFYIILGLLVVLYTLVMVLRPKPLDWTVTLERRDKNPYGSYIAYRQLGDLFSGARITSEQLPAYNLLGDTTLHHTAYVMIAPQGELAAEDVGSLLAYIARGNSAFISAFGFSRFLTDTLHFQVSRPLAGVLDGDSGRVNLTNRALATDTGYGFRDLTLNSYFVRLDTARAEVLGQTLGGKPDFIRMTVGRGTLYLHTAPLAFSNYFMLCGDNHTYTERVLSYLPRQATRLYWDEYYKAGPAYRGSLMRFLLTHLHLRWAWWLGLLAIVLYVFFQSKRRQRAIPLKVPMSNSSLEFVSTISGLYWDRHDNKNIAEKKITYFLERVRSRLQLSTERLDPAFIGALARKSGSSEPLARELVGLIIQVRSSAKVSDTLLLQLNRQINAFTRKLS